jgi:hypothetical protein
MSVNIIHIGYPKTATTWFQNNFYPFVTNFNFCDREVLKRELIFLPFHIKTPDISNLIKPGNNLWCDEMLIGSIQNGSLHGLLMEKTAFRLKEVLPDGEIVLFIRNQFELINSSYFQYLRTGGTLSLKKFLFPKRKINSINQLNNFDFSFFQFDRIIDFYKSVFGSKKVHVFLYEEFLLNQREFIENYARKFNMEYDRSKLDFSFRKSKFPVWLVPFIRFLNVFTNQSILNKYYIIHIPGVYGFVKRLITFFSLKKNVKSKNSFLMMDKETQRNIIDFYKESNGRLIEIFGEEKLKKYNYPV